MSRPRFRSTLLVAALLLACAEQGEGERCELSNDNNDCEPGLVCTPLSRLTGASEGAVCCPDRESSPTTDICRSQVDFDLGGGAGDDDTGDDDTGDDDTGAPIDAGG